MDAGLVADTGATEGAGPEWGAASGADRLLLGTARSTRSAARAAPRFEHALLKACPDMEEALLPSLCELGSFSRGARAPAL